MTVPRRAREWSEIVETTLDEMLRILENPTRRKILGRLVRESHVGFGTDLLRLAAVVLLFLALRARGLFAPDSGALVRLAFLGTALVAAGAALASPTVAGAIALVAAVDLLRTRRATPSTSST